MEIVLPLSIVCVLSAMVLIFLMCPHKGKMPTGMVLNITVLEGKISCLRFHCVLLAGNMLTVNSYFQCLWVGVGERGSALMGLRIVFSNFLLLYSIF